MKKTTFIHLLIASMSVIGCGGNDTSLQPGSYGNDDHPYTSIDIFQNEGRFCLSTRTVGLADNPDEIVQYRVASISSSTIRGGKAYKIDNPEHQNDFPTITQKNNDTISINGTDYFKNSSESSDISIPENVQRCLTSEDAFYEAEGGPL